MMALTRDQMQRANELAERIIDQQRTRIAELEAALDKEADDGWALRVASQDLLDFSYGDRLPIDDPKSRMIVLANKLHEVLRRRDGDDPGTEYGSGGSVDPAPDPLRLGWGSYGLNDRKRAIGVLNHDHKLGADGVCFYCAEGLD